MSVFKDAYEARTTIEDALAWLRDSGGQRAMSNVTECIDLYLNDEEVTDEQFRRFMVEASEMDAQEHDAKVTYWHALREARRERERMEAS